LEAWGDEPWGAEDGPDIERLLGEGYRSADDMTKAAHDVIDERLRQRDVEGWTPEHDDAHDKGELAMVAACYAEGSTGRRRVATISDDVSGGRGETPVWRNTKVLVPERWPHSWDASWWKPSDDRRRDLVKAGALILAEIERIDRATARAAAASVSGEHP
jgi:hypothetical protein